jgi:hypothetical protein
MGGHAISELPVIGKKDSGLNSLKSSEYLRGTIVNTLDGPPVRIGFE